jgi:hypothetical protein
MRTVTALFALVLVPSVLTAQSRAPTGWKFRTDTPPDSIREHSLMPPGWHITTGAGAILYHPLNQAIGRFAIEAEIHLFPGESNDGYGVFLGGRNLESPEATWVAFLMMKDGSATIVQHQGLRPGATSRTTLFPITKTTAIKPHTGGDGTALNLMRVLVQGDSAVFSVNGQRITALGVRDLPLDGTFGFRVGRNLNLHVTNLDHVIRLAPLPVRR